MGRVTVAPAAHLQGELVRLRPREREDVPLFVRWYNDPEVRHWLHISDAPDPTNDSEMERFELASRDPSRLTWVIETGDGQPIGNVSLIAINEVHRVAELGISIGEKEYWGRGYGSDAVQCVLRYAFDGMQLRRVELITDIDNERGIRCYEKCGFVREGILRGKRLRYGQPLDMLMMAAVGG